MSNAHTSHLNSAFFRGGKPSFRLSRILVKGKRGIYDACSVFTEFSKAYLYASIQIVFRQFRVASINLIPLEND